MVRTGFNWLRTETNGQLRPLQFSQQLVIIIKIIIDMSLRFILTVFSPIYT